MLQSHDLKDMGRIPQLESVQKFQEMDIKLRVKHEMMEILMMEMVEALTHQQLNKVGYAQVDLQLHSIHEHTEIIH